MSAVVVKGRVVVFWPFIQQLWVQILLNKIQNKIMQNEAITNELFLTDVSKLEVVNIIMINPKSYKL